VIIKRAGRVHCNPQFFQRLLVRECQPIKELVNAPYIM
jgi:hypothetical protein